MKKRNSAFHPLAIKAMGILLSLALGACHSPPSDQVRTDSFKQTESLFTADRSKTLSAVYHLVTTDADFESISIDAKTGQFSLRFGRDRHFKESLCVGINQNGYLLGAGRATASFCYVIGEFDGVLGVRKARLVHRGSESSRATDFALLKVEAEVNSLPYSPDPTPGEPVFAVVFTKTGEIGGLLDFAGGEVKEVKDNPAAPDGKLVDTSIPFREGDSGGPLLTAEGQLIGITEGWQLQVRMIPTKYRRWSCRPTWQSLAKIMAVND